MHNLEIIINQFEQKPKEEAPETVLSVIFMGWLSSECSGKLSGLDRGNKSFAIDQVRKYFAELARVDQSEKIKMTTKLLDEFNGDSIAELIEELFIGYLGDENAMLGGTYTPIIYQEVKAVQNYFNTLQSNFKSGKEAA